MDGALEKFRARLAAEWIPSFCEARATKGFAPAGFRWDTFGRLSEYDARWFLLAVDHALVTESDGFLTAAKSTAKEQLFWSGSTRVSPRTFTLWTEPIITIGALARLNIEFGWPSDRLACQPEGWGLDLATYDAANRMIVGGEAKKASREIDRLLELMVVYAKEPDHPAPPKGPLINAFKKVVAIRTYRPEVFWAIGPKGESRVFNVTWKSGAGRFAIEEATEQLLACRGLE